MAFFGLFGKEENKIDSNVLNETIQKSIKNIPPTADLNVSGIQYVEITNSNLDNVEIQNKVTGNLKALFDIYIEDDFKIKLDSEIAQELTKKTDALFSGITNIFVDKNTTLETYLTNSVQQMNISNIFPKCLGKTMGSQTVIIKSSTLTNSEIFNTVDSVLDCTTKIATKNKASTDIINKINQSADITEESPLKFLSDIANSFSWSIILIIGLIVGGFIILKPSISAKTPTGTKISFTPQESSPKETSD